MTTHDPPFQFSLQAAFALMLWAAGALVIYRQAGVSAALFSIVGVFHLLVMLQLNNRPRPWNREREEVVALGWFMFAPFVPYGALIFLMTIIHLDVILKGNGAMQLSFLLMSLTVLLLPIMLLCSVQARRLSAQAFVDEPRLETLFQTTTFVLPLGTPVFLCLSGGWW